MGVWLIFYKFAENREFLIRRFLPYKLGIETSALQQSRRNSAFQELDSHPCILILHSHRHLAAFLKVS